MAFVAEPHSNARTVLITLTRKAPLSAKNERINLMSKKVFLEFEKALGEIDAQIEKLENDALENGMEHQSEIARLEREMTTFMNSTVTVPLPMIGRSSGAWPVWANTP